jgi:hypothetical protein
MPESEACWPQSHFDDQLLGRIHSRARRSCHPSHGVLMLGHGQRDQTVACGDLMIKHLESFKFKCEHSPVQGCDLPLSALTSSFQNTCVEFIDGRGRQTTERP